jgi:predicted dithiol-disulfide oxidoreductase (DUF899 family)
MEQPRIVTRDEWLTARKDLLLKEKALTRARDSLSAERRRLPMVKVDKTYVFETPAGRRTLAELFNGKGQLIVYHFMMGPDWTEGCTSCSFLADHIDGSVVHLAHRDVTLIAVSRAPLSNIEAFRKRMGWRFTWASSFGTDFNQDYAVSFTEAEIASGRALYNFGSSPFPLDEAPGLSVFFKPQPGADSGDVFHTYSTYARGGEAVIGTYHYLDFAPRGRDEDGLAFTMSWVRHHDRYDASYTIDPARLYVPPARTGSCCAPHEETQQARG